MGYDIEFTDELGTYVNDNMPPMPELYQRLRVETEALGSIAQMQISWIQTRFMQALIKLSHATTVVEIGSFTGMSALAMAGALPAGGRIYAFDSSEEWTSIAKRYWQEAGVADKIILRLGDAREGLQLLLDSAGPDSVDLVFIDADKKSLQIYLDLAHQLLRPGGLALVDNTLWHGEVIDPENQKSSTNTIRTFNRDLAEDSRFFLSMIPVGDGLSLAVKL